MKYLCFSERRTQSRGNATNCARYFPTQAINFACKERYQLALVPDRATAGFAPWFAGYLAAGGLAGATSLTVVYPLEFSYTRLAADTGKNKQFTGLGNVSAYYCMSTSSTVRPSCVHTTCVADHARSHRPSRPRPRHLIGSLHGLQAGWSTRPIPWLRAIRRRNHRLSRRLLWLLRCRKTVTITFELKCFRARATGSWFSFCKDERHRAVRCLARDTWIQ